MQSLAPDIGSKILDKYVLEWNMYRMCGQAGF